MRAALTCLALAAVPAAAAMDDLTRARTKIPRNEYRAPHPYHAAKRLNAHLRSAHPSVRPCHQWTVGELQELQGRLFALREPEHDRIYRAAGDSRTMRHKTLGEHQQLWAEVGRAAAGHRLLQEMHRDGHCLEAVMWWVHHLSHKTRAALSGTPVPSMPLVHWRQPVREEGTAAQTVWSQHYNPSSTCLSCHSGGLPWQVPDTQPPPLPRQVNGNDRRRRCEEWYGAEEGGACGACDGMAGAYYGDLPDECIYPECAVVNTADEVPVHSRAPTHYPKAFAVEMRGADRWNRASASGNASCNYTSDCSPEATPDQVGLPIPPDDAAFHWYAAIHGVLYVDHKAGLNGGGRLRHETVYQLPSGRKGAERALQGLFGETNIHMTEIHVQTPEMAKTGDPGVMLNIEHVNMNVANQSGADDSKLDWRRIPSTDGTCVCVVDPGGLPYFYGAFDNATYLGRARFVPPWQTTGTGGAPDGKAIVADHWAKWNFHLFVSVETYMPVMFSSAYGGVATYGNWTIMPDALWPEWRENPPSCVNVKDTPPCNPWTPPPAPQ